MSAFYQKKATTQASVEGEESKEETVAAINPMIINMGESLAPKDALLRMKEVSKQRNFKESVEAIFRLAVDPRQGDQNIRGTCILPAGTGKSIKICVFADKSME